MEKLYGLIDGRREALIKDLQGLIRIPSVQGPARPGQPYGENVRRAQQYMLALAGAMGFPTHDMDGQVGWCELGQGQEMVAVLCHLDVVPEGRGWTVPPFGGTVKDGRVYGRGAMDDKGPAVCALHALAALAEAGTPLRRRVRLIFGLNEETGCADMEYYLAHGGEKPVLGFTPDGEYPVINGEKGIINQVFTKTLRQTGPIRLQSLAGGEASNIVPARCEARLSCHSDAMKAVMARRAPKVACMPTPDGVSVTAEGVGAHGGTPEKGENAIGRLMLFLDTLPLEGELKEAVAFLAHKIGLEWDGASLGLAQADDISGPLTFNLGVAGFSVNELTVQLNYRYPVTKAYEGCGPQVLAAFEGAGFRQTHLQHKGAIYMAPDSPLVSKLMAVYRAYTGRGDAPKAIGGGTYAKMMPNILAFGPVFPGDEVREHKPDEYMEITRLMDNAKLIAGAISALAA